MEYQEIYIERMATAFIRLREFLAIWSVPHDYPVIRWKMAIDEKTECRPTFEQFLNHWHNWEEPMLDENNKLTFDLPF